MGLGLELKKILKDKGMSVAELSRLSGVSANTLYAIISRDSSDISLSTLYKISDALNLETDDFAILDMKTNPEKWGLNNNKITSAAHFDGNEYTDEELEEIRQFAEFVKSKRKK